MLSRNYNDFSKKMKKIAFHLLLIPLYFITAQFNQNISEVYLEDLVRPVLVVIACSLFLYLVLLLFMKDSQKAALSASMILFMFFLYGLVYGALKTISISMARHRFLLPLFLILMGVLVWKFSRMKAMKHTLTQLFNLFSIVLLILPAINIFHYYRSLPKANTQPAEVSQTSSVSRGETSGQLPDIYFIIADAYGREDYLKEKYDFANSEFINWLEQEGFYVAHCARSNYAHTVLSLSSSLQMNYISSYASEDQYFDGGLDDYVVHNAVRERLESYGYQTVSFENVHWDFSDADVFYDFRINIFSPYLRPFENMILTNSMFRAAVEFNSSTQEYFSALTSTPVKEHYLRQKFILDTLENEAIELDSPKFVFAHVETPHGPYVFEEDGSFQQEDAFYRGEYYSAINDTYGNLGYITQIKFMNDSLEKIVEKILSESANPPIIIIQGDHSIDEFGPEEDRMKIFYAVYLPDEDYSSFYSSITPVNTFRIIFNQYFGMNYELLEDRAYYSQRADRFTWQEVWEDSSTCQEASLEKY